jgi:hypothetical protein
VIYAGSCFCTTQSVRELSGFTDAVGYVALVVHLMKVKSAEKSLPCFAGIGWQMLLGVAFCWSASNSQQLNTDHGLALS